MGLPSGGRNLRSRQQQGLFLTTTVPQSETAASVVPTAFLWCVRGKQRALWTVFLGPQPQPTGTLLGTSLHVHHSLGRPVSKYSHARGQALGDVDNWSVALTKGPQTLESFVIEAYGLERQGGTA